MSMIKLELKIHEVVELVDSFSKNRKQALETLAQELKDSVGSVVNQILNAEIDIFLGKPEQSDNKRNGYQPEREYALKGVGGIRIRLPKDRKGRFESSVIPRHERVDPRLKADMAVLHLAGLSTRSLSMISKRLLGVEVSKDSVSDSLGLVKEEADKWLTRPIKEGFWALYIDGTNFKVQRRGSTLREPSLVVLGISETNHKSILAIEPGTRDNVDAWRMVFRSLMARGLKISEVKIGIMDGLPGLESLFREEFPNAVTARCWVHSMRNSLAKTPARLREAFKPMLTKVMYAASENEARQAFDTLKETMHTDAHRAVKCIEKDLDSLLTHYRFDKGFWNALKTTNAIERINKELKRRTKTMDSLGENTLMIVTAFTALRLEMGWRKHTVNSKALDYLYGAKKNQRKYNAIENGLEKLRLIH